MLTFHERDFGVGGGETDFQFAGSGFQRGIRGIESYYCTRLKVFLQLARLESFFAQFNGVVSGIDGGDS